jgi:antitoxin component YwqK of YwqJK toxin-antitoxin module
MMHKVAVVSALVALLIPGLVAPQAALAAGRPVVVPGIADDANYVNDKKEGIWTTYFPNGKPSSVAQFKAGLRTGRWSKWYENGQLAENEGYANDKRDGLQTRYFPNGRKGSEETFANGERAGHWAKWYDNGQLAEEGEFLNGKRNGTWSGFFPNGQPREQAHYDQGARVGHWIKWQKPKDVPQAEAQELPDGPRDLDFEEAQNTP